NVLGLGLWPRYSVIDMPGFLTEVHVMGYGCLKDVRCSLTPLHAFIGPNDSGKSTLLRAIQTVLTPKLYRDIHAFAKFVDRSDLRINYGGNDGIFGTDHAARIVPAHVLFADETLKNTMAVRVGKGLAQVQMVRLSADELRQPSSLIPFGTPLVMAGRGSNLAGLYDALRDRSNDRFTAISQRLTDHFPSVQSLGLQAMSGGVKVLTAKLLDGKEILSDAMSEGLLYYLAFAILGELQRPAVYLVEEPENGLHPARIADIVAILRTVAEDTKDPVQIVMATHSPLVVNELRPEEVTVVRRDPLKGTSLTPIKQTPHFEERSKAYALGELWLSYADGKLEAPLFDSEGR
ncbi:MAG: AAA family ATPase, partial [Polyangiaceae bacterium]